MQLDEQRLRFRDAMASLSAAVNVITTEGEAGRCGITATAVCSVTDTPPSVMVCINANSAMNPVFQGNGKLCINVLNHEQEEMARHFAGMTGMTMDDRFGLSGWQKVQLSRHPERPYTLFYLTTMCDKFIELHGDRCGGDDEPHPGTVGAR